MIGRRLKDHIPWWGKIAAKLVLSRIPFNYRTWKRIGIFRHGRMDKAAYAHGVFLSHVRRAGLEDQLYGKTVLELGPGDSVATAVLANAYGARAILVDSGYFAFSDPLPYVKLADSLQRAGLQASSITVNMALEDILHACESKYHTDGQSSLKSLPSHCCDLVFSQAVLEHVRKREFADVQKELARIVKPQGVCSHRVDLRDHLGGGLNNLRFSEHLWESEFFANSGFYTNRLSFEDMIHTFRQAGFHVDVTNVRRWEHPPIKRSQLAVEFQGRSDESLMISGFDILLRRKDGVAGDPA